MTRILEVYQARRITHLGDDGRLRDPNTQEDIYFLQTGVWTMTDTNLSREDDHNRDIVKACYQMT